MIRTLLSILILFFILPAFAQEGEYGDLVRYKYNPIQEWWKFKANKSTLHYNPMADEFVYKYPTHQLHFNPAEDTWEFAEIDKQLHYDILREKWFYFGEYFLSEREKDKPRLKLTPLSPIEPSLQPADE